MCIFGFEESDVAEFPFALDWRGSDSFDVKLGAAKRDNQIIVVVNVPKDLVLRSHGYIPDADKFVLEFRTMMRFGANLHGLWFRRVSGQRFRCVGRQAPEIKVPHQRRS